jgi:hypothetical protein
LDPPTGIALRPHVDLRQYPVEHPLWQARRFARRLAQAAADARSQDVAFCLMRQRQGLQQAPPAAGHAAVALQPASATAAVVAAWQPPQSAAEPALARPPSLQGVTPLSELAGLPKSWTQAEDDLIWQVQMARIRGQPPAHSFADIGALTGRTRNAVKCRWCVDAARARARDAASCSSCCALS